jgi:hypothetical protein
MAKVYVSYRRREQEFVTAVMSRLEQRHDVRVDYNVPAGADWRTHLLDDLRASDVFLVFVSEGTAESDFQNAEIGAARFCSAFIDGKLIIPVLIDNCPLPRTVDDLDRLDLTRRDPDEAARQIEDALIWRRVPRVRLFISHAHRDQDLASRLVDVLTSGFQVPPGELRCTSVPGYQLDLGTMAPDSLRRELGSAACVIAILTPNSLGAEWVLFELGAAWANARLPIPLLAGSLEDKDIPGPLRGAAGGKLSSPVALDLLVDQVARDVGWPQRSGPSSRAKRYELAEYAAKKSFARDLLEDELQATFTAKRARIGSTQNTLLDYVTDKQGGRPHVSMEELSGQFPKLASSLHYRLEQLRLLGFLDRTEVGGSPGAPEYGWSLAKRYRSEVGL